MHRILIERTAEQDLKKLPKKVFNRIVPLIKKLAENPRPQGCHKIRTSKNDWRIRDGEYRIVYEVDDSQKEVRILRVKHRKDVYR
jgi:mRNA interferase RelE/StbE